MLRIFGPSLKLLLILLLLHICQHHYQHSAYCQTLETSSSTNISMLATVALQVSSATPESNLDDALHFEIANLTNNKALAYLRFDLQQLQNPLIENVWLFVERSMAQKNAPNVNGRMFVFDWVDPGSWVDNKISWNDQPIGALATDVLTFQSADWLGDDGNFSYVSLPLDHLSNVLNFYDYQFSLRISTMHQSNYYFNSIDSNRAIKSPFLQIQYSSCPSGTGFYYNSVLEASECATLATTPTNFTALLTPELKVQLNWNPIPNAVYYTIQNSTNNITFTQYPNTGYYKITNFETPLTYPPNITLYFRIYAANFISLSKQYAEASVSTPKPVIFDNLIVVVAAFGAVLLICLILIALLAYSRYKHRLRRRNRSRNLEERLLTQKYVEMNENEDEFDESATILNTFVGGEILLPGYLKIEFGRDLRVEKQLKVGGEATIYSGVILSTELRSKHPDIVDDVIVKMQIPRPSLSEEENNARFTQEVAIMGSLLSHPNVVKLFAFTEKPNCIVCVKYEKNLGQLIHHKETYNTLQLADMLYQLSSALTSLHARQIAHRDIKPSNILLERRFIPPDPSPFKATTDTFLSVSTLETKTTYRRESTSSIRSKRPGHWSDFGYTVKLGDFGICFVDPVETYWRFPASNIFGISYPYASPEMFLNANNLSVEEYQKADVYSFAIVAWEILHRIIPWNGLTTELIKQEVLNGKRPEITIEAGADGKLVFFKSLIETCWDSDPNTRVQFKDIVSQIKGLIDLEQNTPTLITSVH